MVNAFRLRSIINSLYGQVTGDLETCSRLWRIMLPRAEVNKFPSPLPPERTTNTVTYSAPGPVSDVKLCKCVTISSGVSTE